MAAALLAAAVPSAFADSGGQSVPDAPAIDSVKCTPTSNSACPTGPGLVRGGRATIKGSDLEATAAVVFRGGRGKADDVRAKLERVSSYTLVVRVPAAAKSGRIAAQSEFGTAASARAVAIADAPRSAPVDAAPGGRFFLGGKRKPVFSFDATADGPVDIEVIREADGAVVRTLTATAVTGQRTDVGWDGRTDSGLAGNGQYRFALSRQGAAAASAAPVPAFALFDHVFPIRGRHNMGYTATNDFGGARNHKGQDMFAACGTPVAAARGGRVEYAGYHSAAGNYVVIEGDSGHDYVYMHLRLPAGVRAGQRVFTGQQLGEVGETGRATGCHLHFELWSAPGWYKGGAAFDPKPQLKAWDAYS